MNVDDDANQVGYTKLQLASGPAAGTFFNGHGIEISGINIRYVCDSACRHHSKSKQASLQHALQREPDRLGYFQAKTELAILLQSDVDVQLSQNLLLGILGFSLVSQMH
jgi:hypothetical protein